MLIKDFTNWAMKICCSYFHPRWTIYMSVISYSRLLTKIQSDVILQFIPVERVLVADAIWTLIIFFRNWSIVLWLQYFFLHEECTLLPEVAQIVSLLCSLHLYTVSAPIRWSTMSSSPSIWLMHIMQWSFVSITDLQKRQILLSGINKNKHSALHIFT